MSFSVDERARLHEERLEAREHLPRHDLEPALRFIRAVERIHGVPQRLWRAARCSDTARGADAGAARRTGQARCHGAALTAFTENRVRCREHGQEK